MSFSYKGEHCVCIPTHLYDSVGEGGGGGSDILKDLSHWVDKPSKLVTHYRVDYVQVSTLSRILFPEPSAQAALDKYYRTGVVLLPRLMIGCQQGQHAVL